MKFYITTHIDKKKKKIKTHVMTQEYDQVFTNTEATQVRRKGRRQNEFGEIIWLKYQLVTYESNVKSGCLKQYT
jgi:hypothetical protein